MSNKEFKETKENEKITISKSYLFNFYEEIENLTNLYSNYLNILVTYGGQTQTNKTDELFEKYSKLNQGEKDVIRNVIDQLRFYITNTKIRYSTLKQKLALQDIKEIDEVYKKLVDSYVYPPALLEQYVQSFNSVLVESIIESLLEDNEDWINKVTK
jgi:hypothetical protein